MTSRDAKDDKGNLLDIIELTIEAPPKPNKFLAKVFQNSFSKLHVRSGQCKIMQIIFWILKLLTLMIFLFFILFFLLIGL